MDAQRLFKSYLVRNERVAAQGCDFCGLASGDQATVGLADLKIEFDAPVGERMIRLRNMSKNVNLPLKNTA